MTVQRGDVTASEIARKGLARWPARGPGILATRSPGASAYKVVGVVAFNKRVFGVGS